MMDDLDRLIAAVEAGRDQEAMELAYPVFGDRSPTGHVITVIAKSSLDAALRLHEALLPGWGWMMGNKGTVTAIPPEAMFAEHGIIGPTCRVSDSPARAWLLAILRAVKAQQSPGGGA